MPAAAQVLYTTGAGSITEGLQGKGPALHLLGLRANPDFLVLGAACWVQDQPRVLRPAGVRGEAHSGRNPGHGPGGRAGGCHGLQCSRLGARSAPGQCLIGKDAHQCVLPVMLLENLDLVRATERRASACLLHVHMPMYSCTARSALQAGRGDSQHASEHLPHMPQKTPCPYETVLFDPPACWTSRSNQCWRPAAPCYVGGERGTVLSDHGMTLEPQNAGSGTWSSQSPRGKSSPVESPADWHTATQHLEDAELTWRCRGLAGPARADAGHHARLWRHPAPAPPCGPSTGRAGAPSL